MIFFTNSKFGRQVLNYFVTEDVDLAFAKKTFNDRNEESFFIRIYKDTREPLIFNEVKPSRGVFKLVNGDIFNEYIMYLKGGMPLHYNQVKSGMRQ